MGCTSTTVKVSYIIFNILLAILSITVITWISFNPDSLLENVAIGAYTACSLVIFFTFLGCFATIRESVCLTATCAAFLLILAIVQIIFTAVNMSNDGTNDMDKMLNEAWDNNQMNKIQIDYECCGRTSVNDYILLNKSIPTSCYINQDNSNDNNLFKEGCSNKLRQQYNDALWYFQLFSWILVAFEILGFLLAVLLVINFRNTQRRMRF